MPEALLFLGGSCFYVFTVAALGILLGTVAATMGQFGLLAIPAIGHDAAVGRHDADGKHAGLAAVPHEGGQPDAAFRRFRPGCALSRRRPLNRMAGDFGHGGHRRCLLRVRFAPLPQRDLWRLNEPGLNLRSESTWGILPTPRVLPPPNDADALHCGISVPSMSAMGQERTSPILLAMSALPPKADIRLSALYHKQTRAITF